MPTGSKDAPDEFTNAVAVVIRAKMGILNRNITDVANETKIPRSSLSNILNGKRGPDLSQVRKIAEAVNIPLATLITKAEGYMAGKDPF